MLGSRRIYSVSELTSLLKTTIEQQFANVTIEGEISNLRLYNSGHLYFTIKDSNAVISAVLFANRHGRLAFQPQDGMKVEASGSVSVYPPRGNYQLICEDLQPAGEGALLKMLAERKRRLAAEGLFDSERKQPLPPFPQRVAVVTSPNGAAIRDIIRVTGRRDAGLNLVILPTLVQGAEAGAQIAAQIARADRFQLGEVIIVARGGGSLEDLLPFSDEVVLRAIAAAQTPIISAVGHETDVPLCDLVADLRAATPSEAAERVSYDRVQLQRQVLGLGHEIVARFLERYRFVRLRLQQLDPARLAQDIYTSLQLARLRLENALEQSRTDIQRSLADLRHRLELAASTISAASPQATLQRGYAIVTHAGGLLTDAAQAQPDEPLKIRFAASLLHAHTLSNDNYRQTIEPTTEIETIFEKHKEENRNG